MAVARRIRKVDEEVGVNKQYLKAVMAGEAGAGREGVGHGGAGGAAGGFFRDSSGGAAFGGLGAAMGFGDGLEDDEMDAMVMSYAHEANY